MLLENQLGTGFRVLLTRTNKGLLQNPGFQLLHLKQGFRISKEDVSKEEMNENEEVINILLAQAG